MWHQGKNHLWKRLHLLLFHDKCRNYVWSLHVHFMLTFYMLKRLLEQFQEPLWFTYLIFRTRIEPEASTKSQISWFYWVSSFLSVTQTPNFLLALWCLKPYFPFISVHLCTVLTVVSIFPQNFIVILLSRAYFSFLIFRLDLHLFILIFTFFNT